jgi:Ion channel
MPEEAHDRKEHRPTGKRVFSRGELFRHSFAWFLASLALLLVASPLVEHWPNGALIESVLLSVVMLFAVPAIGGRRSRLIWAIVLLIPALLGKWVNFWRPDLAPPEVFLGFGMLFIVYVVLNILGYILRAPRVSSEILCAAIANYLMLGLLWSFAYTVIAAAIPDAFAFSTGPESSHVMKGFNSVYFSFATLSTIGYGDISPVAGGARILAVAEAVVGMFYVTMLIARLVSLYSTKDSVNS